MKLAIPDPDVHDAIPCMSFEDGIKRLEMIQEYRSRLWIDQETYDQQLAMLIEHGILPDLPEEP